MRDKISIGTPARLRLEAPANSAHDVRVSMVDRVVDAASSTFRIRLTLPNLNHRILDKTASQDSLQSKN